MPETHPYEILHAQIGALNERTFVLAPSATVLSRTRDAIQFGLRSATAGIISVPTSCFDAVFDVLKQCRDPRNNVAQALMDAGLDNIGALSLLADLTTYGILREVGPRPVVAVAGRSQAAIALRHVLSAAGITVRSPLTAESDAGFFHRIDSSIPMVVIDRHGLSTAFARFLTRRPNVIPAFVLDATAVVGPVRIGGKGPCVNCFDLYQESTDPQWRSLANQCVATEPKEPVAQHMLATVTASVVMAMVGIDPGCGVKPLEIQPGSLLYADPFGLSIEHAHMDVHSLCHACFRKDADKELFTQTTAEQLAS